MKIIHIGEYFYPQLGYQIAFLAKEHANLGNDVYVVTSDRYSPIIYEDAAMREFLGERIRKPGFFIEEGIKTWRLKTLFEVDSTCWLIGFEDKIRELKPDILYVHGITTLSATRVAFMKLKSHKFKLVIDNYTIPIGSRSKWRIVYPLFRWTSAKLILKATDALAAPADEAKLFMNRKCGIPLDRIKVIQHGADDILFHHDAKAREEIREQLGISNEVVFIYTGKITLDKGVHLLVEAGIDLIRKHGNLKIIILGGGSTSYINDMKQRINSEGLEDYFLWLDTVPNSELYKFYSATDVAVWPCSVTISTLEAMACGLPVIVSNLPAAIERVSFDNGFIVKNGSVAELEKYMGELLLNQELRREMGKNSRKAIEEKLNWRRIAEQFIELVSPEKEAI